MTDAPSAITVDDHPKVTRWHVRVEAENPRYDGHGRAVLADIHRLGLTHIEAVAASRIYFLTGPLEEADVRLVAHDLLADPVAEVHVIERGFSPRDGPSAAIEVHPRPGVMNPVALSTKAAVTRMLRKRGSVGSRIDEVHTARRYRIIGARSAEELERIAGQVLANGCVETWYVQGLGREDRIPERFPAPPDRGFSLRRVSLRDLDDQALMRLSREAHLFLSLAEMHAIRDHFRALDRDPTDLELETFAQTWSEHCVHKTLKSTIEYSGDDFGRPGSIEARFVNLLKDTIVRATSELKRDWCLSVFVDNAGIVAFDDEFGIAVKVETHNHPSAIEPYGGASTGVGGCIRDIMGCGLGGKPIASTDVFCLAPPDYDPARIPKDVLHPRRVLKGVVSGVRDYGNRMGIPTVNGAIHFDERYLANPLVFCGCVGLIPRARIAKTTDPGDYIVLAGGRTGRDGIHGATFSSAELTDTHADEFSHAVQIGNAVEEKKLLDALLLARDHEAGCLFSALTDCGAGGISCAIGEMAAELGAEVSLDTVPLKYHGLRYDEIWISEAQERMIFSVPPDRLDTFLSVFADEEVEATVVGRFTNDRILRVRYQGTIVGEIALDFLHHGIPRQVRRASWRRSLNRRNEQQDAADHAYDANERLLSTLHNGNVASKEWVIRQYDHEVQGRSVIKPLAGPGSGPADAAVLRPRHDRDRGIAIGCGLCPEIGDDDPYWMAVCAVDEALRNVICVGADPDRTAILDNFCWPKCDSQESLGALVRACRGAADAALAFGLPFVSGKDSLNNQFAMSPDEARRTGLPQNMVIPYTLLITAVGIVADVRRCVSSDLKRPGSVLVFASAPVRQAGLNAAHDLHQRVARLIGEGKVLAAHDVSDGGLAVTVAEMCIAGNLGASVRLDDASFDHSLFAPIPTSYVLEMSQSDATASGLPVIGRIDAEPRLDIQTSGRRVVDAAVSELARAWRAPLAMGGER